MHFTSIYSLAQSCMTWEDGTSTTRHSCIQVRKGYRFYLVYTIGFHATLMRNQTLTSDIVSRQLEAYFPIR
jgi:hypothetical protein